MRISKAVAAFLLGFSVMAGGQSALGCDGLFDGFLLPPLGLKFLFTAPTGPSSRVALAQRQRLYNEVRYAMLDGYISPDERCALLVEAKDILRPDEYCRFHKMLDEISPPRKCCEQFVQRTAHQRAESASRLSLQMPKATSPKPNSQANPAANPVVPAGATLPERPATSTILQ